MLSSSPDLELDCAAPRGDADEVAAMETEPFAVVGMDLDERLGLDGMQRVGTARHDAEETACAFPVLFETQFSPIHAPITQTDLSAS